MQITNLTHNPITIGGVTLLYNETKTVKKIDDMIQFEYLLSKSSIKVAKDAPVKKGAKKSNDNTINNINSEGNSIKNKANLEDSEDD